VDLNGWAWRDPAHMETALSTIRTNPANHWMKHLTQEQENSLGPVAGPAAALAYTNRRDPIGRIIKIFKTDRQIPSVVSDSSVFEV
jgi:hypothetical protein